MRCTMGDTTLPPGHGGLQNHAVVPGLRRPAPHHYHTQATKPRREVPVPAILSSWRQVFLELLSVVQTATTDQEVVFCRVFWEFSVLRPAGAQGDHGLMGWEADGGRGGGPLPPALLTGGCLGSPPRVPTITFPHRGPIPLHRPATTTGGDTGGWGQEWAPWREGGLIPACLQTHLPHGGRSLRGGVEPQGEIPSFPTFSQGCLCATPMVFCHWFLGYPDSGWATTEEGGFPVLREREVLDIHLLEDHLPGPWAEEWGLWENLHGGDHVPPGAPPQTGTHSAIPLPRRLGGYGFPSCLPAWALTHLL